MTNGLLRVGELVRPRPGQMNLPGDAVGLVAEVQRRRVCVWFPDHYQRAWLMHGHLVRLRWRGDPRAHLWSLVSWLILTCRGQAFEWVAGPPHRLSVQTDILERSTLEAVAGFLGPSLQDWAVRPSSLSALWVEWIFTFPVIEPGEGQGA
ncbi:MAG: hypothetical protein NZ742_11485 [Acidobacteria bacterium]|nr:hypothetical protein [Acidobacteriota bacterium]MDW7983794.1 hypothetical protein [Acidobacteriota bacterium]